MRVSVVICTYNRGDGLAATIDCLELQRYQDFEVVVVNGPSTDHTEEVLARYAGRIRTCHNPQANLSISRNIGIRAAAGEIVAFIDDDALPEPAWLEQAVPEFDDPEVAGVGGVVIDHTGMAMQYVYSGSSRFGEPVFSEVSSFEGNSVPGTACFPYLQGTNALFRRSALARIGLFDEVFDFYLDETDVCCRLVDAGFVLRQLPCAAVHHKYLPSDRRNEARVVTRWDSIVRNHVYFGYRHALVDADELEVLDRALRFVEYAVGDARYHEELGVVPPGHVARTREACGAALSEGISLGREARCRSDVAVELPADQEFVPFGPHPVDRLRILLVSSGYPPALTGGISRFIADVAPELARAGHEVRVITRAVDVERVDLERGVWVHRIDPAEPPGLVLEAPHHVDGFASAVVAELERISAWWMPDVVYGPLWDVETLGIARTHSSVPVVVMLATPVAEVAEHEGWTDRSHPAHATYLAMTRLEREMLARATIIHGISDAVVETYRHLYPGAVVGSRLRIAHIGRGDDVGRRDPAISSGVIGSGASHAVVLFVGRLEPRKGIDVFLDACATLLAERPTLRIRVAGADDRPGPDGRSYRDAWAARAGSDAAAIEFLGETDDDVLAELMDEATVVVMPSRYESFGLVVVEAMMHGRAVVASRIGGISELVDDGVTGLLVPVGDADALAAALAKIVDDPDLAHRLGQSGRLRFVDRLTAEAAATRLIAVLRDAIGTRRHGGPAG
jgi:glycogen synthase